MSNPILELVSRRMIFRKLTTTDYEDYANWYQNEAIMAYITGRALTENETKTRFMKVIEENEIHEQLGWFGAYHKTNHRFIGIGKLVPQKPHLVEIGYGLIPDLWNDGYGTEMTTLLLDHVAQFDFVKSLTAIASPENDASIKILVNLNFSKFKEGIDKSGKPFVEYRKELVI